MGWPAEPVYPPVVPDQETEPCDWKVDYWTQDGAKFTAYLDNITHNQLVAYGTEKHSDRPVMLIRDHVDERWTEAT